ncbi:MAG: hypothetical protein K9I69_02985 [Ignavibacteriales bacterium]|nr:hypothetical protein [Ignavibacteriales bacterium]MCF8306548.1 hypothetical protein [Ignavibacteriales bacterium]MCF8316347.1 hypothetical protein [Ignavibacteriales bacterium]MCF8437695.1 hypothetical protein [Ignavibacteriales bacterium]
MYKNNLTPEKESRIFELYYGRLPWISRLILLLELEMNPNLKSEAESVRKTAELLRRADKLEYSGIAVNLADFRKIKKSAFFAQPYFAYTFSFIMLIVGLFWFGREPEKARFTEFEALKARREAIASLEIVTKVLNNSQKTLVNEILGKHVLPPINKGLQTLESITQQGESL